MHACNSNMATAMIPHRHVLQVRTPPTISRHSTGLATLSYVASYQRAFVRGRQPSPSARGSSSSWGLSVLVAAGMGSPEGRRYPPGVHDVGFSLLRAPKLILAEAERRRLDESPDAAFYASPRTMQHAEPRFIAALTGVYRGVLRPGAAVLELCASRHSHLPAGLGLSRLVGQGMNAEELAGNPALSQWWVQDLNAQPLLLEQVDASYNAVLCVNGLQYLTQPEAVLTEAWRVLRPGGLLLVAFGSHFFPEKALAGWTTRGMQQRSELVTRLLQANGFDQVQVLDSIAAAQAAAAAAAAGQGSSCGEAASHQQATAKAEAPAAATTAADEAQDVDIRVLIATKPCLQPFNSPLTTMSAAAGGADPAAAPGAGGMRPDNVRQWFTKPGLAGLAESAAAAAAGGAGDSEVSSPAEPIAAGNGDATTVGEVGKQEQQQQQQQQQPAGVSGAFSEARLLQQWVASYEVLVGDAADLGIPRSVIPQLGRQPSPAEVQAAVGHLQAMVASFLSSGL